MDETEETFPQPGIVKHTRRSMTPVRMLNAVDKVLDDALNLTTASTIEDLQIHLKDLIVIEAQLR